MKTRLREIRESKGLNCAEFAISLSMHPSRMSMIERGVRVCKRNARKIADALGVDVHEVFPEFEKFREG